MHQYTPFINTSAYFMQKYGDSLDLADNKVSPIYLCNLKMHGIYAFNSCQSISYHYCFVSNTNVYWNYSSSLHYDEIFYWFFLYFLKFITVAYKPYKHAIMFLINFFSGQIRLQWEWKRRIKKDKNRYQLFSALNNTMYS